MDPVTLDLSPSCHNCLAWSKDGILAIAAGDYTNLLVPKTAHSEFDRSDPASNRAFQWHSIRIRTNQFTFREWPIQDPLSYKNFSLGEEQSTSKVVALGWSPEGLGRNCRCVLCILTSNCVLSMWEAQGHPREPRTWKRVGLVNDALRMYFGGVLGEDSDKEERKEIERRKVRVRAFDWSPKHHCEAEDGPFPLPHHADLTPRHRFTPPWRIYDSLESPDPTKSTRDDRKKGLFYMVITNDDNDLIFARVYRKFSIEGFDSSIQVDVISHVHLCPMAPRNIANYQEYSLQGALSAPQYVRQVSWGPLSVSSKSENERNLESTSLVAFLHGDKLGFYKIAIIEAQELKRSDVGKNTLTLFAKPATFVHETVNLSSKSFDGHLQWCHYPSQIFATTQKISEGVGEDGESLLRGDFHAHLAVTSNRAVTLITFPSNIYSHCHDNGQRCEFCEKERVVPLVSQCLHITRRELSRKQNNESRFQKALWEQTTGKNTSPLNIVVADGWQGLSSQ